MGARVRAASLASSYAIIWDVTCYGGALRERLRWRPRRSRGRERSGHFWSERVLDGFKPAGFVVEVAEIVVHEADQPNLLADLLDADALAGEDGAEIDLLPIEADAPACGHDDGSCRGNGNRVPAGLGRDALNARIALPGSPCSTPGAVFRCYSIR